MDKVDTSVKRPPPAWRECGEECPTRSAYPNGKKRPADVCNRAAGHEGAHWKTDGRTFRRLAEWT